jgi:1-acyl-sn-glycerol-3-phosphate acyltransferase
MLRTFCKVMLKLLGWKAMAGEMPDNKAIIIGVPHTSMWDFVISWLYYTSVGGMARVMIKSEMFFWPLGGLLLKMGAIPVDRSRGVSLLKQTINAFDKYEKFHLAIAPEGTRALTKKWKAGFHAISKATGAKVYLGFFDWGRKEVGWYETLELSNDPQADISRMKAYYRKLGVIGKHPELFTAEE